jgi:hypothetical protein
MHPTIQHELMTARVADRHRHTGRGQLADAASRARQLPRQPGTYPVIGTSPVFSPGACPPCPAPASPGPCDDRPGKRPRAAAGGRARRYR